MGVLRVIKKSEVLQEFEVETIKKAKLQIDAMQVDCSLQFVYSTFSKSGIENTVTIQKK